LLLQHQLESGGMCDEESGRKWETNCTREEQWKTDRAGRVENFQHALLAVHLHLLQNKQIECSKRKIFQREINVYVKMLGSQYVLAPIGFRLEIVPPFPEIVMQLLAWDSMRSAQTRFRTWTQTSTHASPSRDIWL
jgi:hypothetical protein